jgi:hypothetical protein
MRYRYEDDRFFRSNDAWGRDRDRETRRRGREDDRGWGSEGRHFNAEEDMGGSGWSGYSGRGGMSYAGSHEGMEYGGYGRGYGYGGGPSGSYGGPREPGGYGSYGAGERAWGRDRDRWDRDFGGRNFDRDMDRDRSMFWGGDDYREREREYYGRADWRPEAPVRHEFGRDLDEERGPFYGKGPKGYRRSDERIREDVCELIANQGHIDASDVEVKVDNCIVTLLGTVPRRNDKRALEHLVERARGVDEVHNELRLKRDERVTNERDVSPQRNNGNRHARA